MGRIKNFILYAWFYASLEELFYASDIKILFWLGLTLVPLGLLKHDNDLTKVGFSFALAAYAYEILGQLFVVPAITFSFEPVQAALRFFVAMIFQLIELSDERLIVGIFLTLISAASFSYAEGLARAFIATLPAIAHSSPRLPPPTTPCPSAPTLRPHRSVTTYYPSTPA